MSDTHEVSSASARSFDAVVVGAGFAGMYMLHKLRLLGLSVIALEAGSNVGGTWYWNRYPGARCDIESIQYQYGFSEELQRNWTWSERYASQPEILRYQNYVADTLGLRPDMQFNTRVMSATFDDQTKRWTVVTDQGDEISTRYFIMATGNLSASRVPEIAGLDTFEGEWYHTGDWPHQGVDFFGKRVAVVGTGSSGIQAIPEIAREAKHLTVFQRTPSFSLPAYNRPLDPEYTAKKKDEFSEEREKAKHTWAGLTWPLGSESALGMSREEAYAKLENRWREGGLALQLTFADILLDKKANDVVADFVRTKIRDQIDDPVLLDLLLPEDYPFGAKRCCLDTDYFVTFTRPNVTLVDVRRTPIDRVGANAIVAGDTSYEVDAIVFATGFDAMTGAIMKVDIRGKGGLMLREEWAAGPRTYLGLAVAGFPNMFLITAPGSPSVLTNNIMAIEQHVEWIADCIADMVTRGAEAIEARSDAQERWVEHVNELASGTLMPAANSWYLGANVPGKTRVFMPYVGGLDYYRQKCDDVRANGYEGFVIEGDHVGDDSRLRPRVEA